MTRGKQRNKSANVIIFFISFLILIISVPLFVLATGQSAKPGESTVEKFNFVPPKGDHDGEAVEQPIDFPHNIHVKDNQINCMYCHTYARRSKVAGIPPSSKCMGCHSVIATDRDRIKKLTEYWEKKQPPQWKKLHDVPDFVHFSHEKHLKKFVFEPDFPVEKVKEICAFCHGDIENMTVARKVKPLNMGWCRSCHIQNNGPSDCWKCHK